MSENDDPINQENTKQVHQLSEMDRLTAVVGQMIQDIRFLKDSMGSQGQYLAALLRAIEEGRNLTKANIDDCLISIRVAELDMRIKNQVNSGVLKSTDVVGQRSVVICKQMGHDSKEINRKISLPIFDMHEEFRAKFLDKKVGERVVVEKMDQDGTTVQLSNTFHILEIYDVVEKVEQVF